ncbi:MAG: NUDIX domain-containing protein [Patescibacteria group bacterium]
MGIQELLSSVQVTCLFWPRRGRTVWLGLKGYGDGANKRVPPGGKLELTDKTLAACAIRETREELSIEAILARMRLFAVVFYEHFEKPKRSRLTFHFDGEFTGEPQDSVELHHLHPFPLSRLPFKKMWPAEKLWLLDAFEGRLALPHMRCIRFDADRRIVNSVPLPRFAFPRPIGLAA